MAGTQAEIVEVPRDAADAFFPLIRDNWPGQQRSPARARAAGMPATPLEVTIADVLAWDRERGEPPLEDGFTPEQERAVLARYDGRRGMRLYQDRDDTVNPIKASRNRTTNPP